MKYLRKFNESIHSSDNRIKRGNKNLIVLATLLLNTYPFLSGLQNSMSIFKVITP